MGERLEVLLRIPLSLVYGIILGAWGLVVGVAVVFHWFYVLILGRRHEGIAKFTNKYLSYAYEVRTYLDLVVNKRPWPIGEEEVKELRPTDIPKK